MIDTCVACGNITSEGRLACIKCENPNQNKNNKFVVFVNGMQIYCDTEEKVNHLANLHKNEVITIRRLL